MYKKILSALLESRQTIWNLVYSKKVLFKHSKDKYNTQVSDLLNIT